MKNKCIWCKEKEVKSIRNYFCCKEHYYKYQYCENFLNWYYNPKESIKNNQLRSYLETIYGHFCHRCKINKWNNKPIVFDVHHIDGNSLNNNLNNIIILCPNCHSLTNNYSYKNIGKGRYKTLKKKNEN